MAVQLNHTIVLVHDKSASATFLADILGLEPPRRDEPFMVVELANGTSLDFMDTTDQTPWQHYAFMVGEDEFDEIFGRIRDRALPYWADPHHSQAGEINHRDGGRGVYFDDPDGHNLEIITRPYGSGA
jgi:catechol 2,3-dioxygenase-like lactoylglutathione lyase family enzyme